MTIVVFNAGSSSLKFGLHGDDARPLASGVIDFATQGARGAMSVSREGEAPVRTEHAIADVAVAIARVLEALVDANARAQVKAVGHRVVHGGTTLSQSVRIDARVKAEIARLTALAPLHQPAALAAIEAAEHALPGIPHVAVFDTAFFAALPPAQHVYPLPYAWHAEWGVRRFGFHGISHAYCAARAAEVLGRSVDGLRTIVCHLGQGCSATATRGGNAVATTMGFTPLDGLMMGSRPGALDPGILTYVQAQHGVTVPQLEHALNHESGLLGVSGVSADFRAVEAAAGAGNARAVLALEIYANRVREAVGALAVTFGGVDALVFTAGVGEHSASLRAAVCAGLDCLGLRLDARKNASCEPDADVAAADSAGRILVLRTREELMIAREVARLV